MDKLRKKYKHRGSKKAKANPKKKKQKKKAQLRRPIKRKQNRPKSQSAKNVFQKSQEKKISPKDSKHSEIEMNSQITRQDQKKTRPKPTVKTSTSDPMTDDLSKNQFSKSKKGMLIKKKKVFFKRIDSDSSNLVIHTSSSSVIIQKDPSQKHKMSPEWRYNSKKILPKLSYLNNSKKVPQYQKKLQKRKKRKSDEKRLLRNPMGVLHKARRASSVNKLSLRKLPFQRLVKHQMMSLRRNHSDENLSSLRITKEALQMLQIVTEMKMVRMLEDAYLCTVHAKRVTLMNKDLLLLKRLKPIHESSS